MHLTSARRLLLVATLITLVAASAPLSRPSVALALLLLAPGYLLERWLGGPPRPLLIRLSLWLGLSLSLIALLYQWLWVWEISLAPLPLAFGAYALALATFAALWHGGRPSQGFPSAHVPLSLGLTFIIFILTLWTRFVQITDLSLPAWVDSVHHTLMVQVTLDTGMAPVSLEPYLPVSNMPYHWGYHVVVASVAQLAQQPAVEAILFSGQILNALHSLTAAGLALALWRRPAAAPLAALVVGLLSLMPAYYVSWGRYTQLTGLLMLPAAAIAWQTWLRHGGRGWWLVSVLVVAGLSLVHMRVLIFTLALLAAQSLVWALTSRRNRLPPSLPLPHTADTADGAGAHRWRKRLGYQRRRPPTRPGQPAQATLVAGIARAGGLRSPSRGLQPDGASAGIAFLLSLVSAALAVAILTAPWLRLLLRQTLLPSLSAGSLSGGGSYNAINTGLLWVGQMHGLVALALLGGIIGLWQRQRSAATLMLWVGLLVLAANPALLSPVLAAAGVVGLIIGARRRNLPLFILGLALMVPLLGGVAPPAFWLITNDAMMISLFLPVALLISGGGAICGARIVARARPSWRPALVTCGIGAVLALSLWGANELRVVLNPTTVLTNQADRDAIAWVAANTPSDARFLINATPWLTTARRGVDGGWWLLPLTGRWTSTPPVLFVYGDPAYVSQVNAVGDTVIAYKPGDEQPILDLIRRERISHIYIVEGRGPLQSTTFAGRPGFSLVYAADGVVIFAVDADGL